MNLALLGGTGRTGQLVVDQALRAGNSVRVLARQPEKLAVPDSRLEVVQGDLTNKEQLARVIDGVDAVISTLGPTNNKATFEISNATANLVEAMKDAGLRRLVITAGAGVSAPGDQPKAIDKVIVRLLKTFNRNVYEDMVRTVEIVKDSDLDWTIVRVPRLTDGPATGKIRSGAVGADIGTQLTRADLAAYLLQVVETTSTYRSMPAVSN